MRARSRECDATATSFVSGCATNAGIWQRAPKPVPMTATPICSGIVLPLSKQRELVRVLDGNAPRFRRDEIAEASDEIADALEVVAAVFVAGVFLEQRKLAALPPVDVDLVAHHHAFVEERLGETPVTGRVERL